MPRNRNKGFEELGFKLVKEKSGIGSKTKYSAFCFTCQIVLNNTAESRLKSHRAVCKRRDGDKSDPDDVHSETSNSDSNTDCSSHADNTITTQKRSVSSMSTSSDFESLRRCRKKRFNPTTLTTTASNTNNTTAVIANGSSTSISDTDNCLVPNLLQNDDINIIFDQNVDVESDFNNILPPGRQYRVLGVNNSNDPTANITRSNLIDSGLESIGSNLTDRENVSNNSSLQGTNKVFPLFNARSRSRSQDLSTLGKSYNDVESDSSSISLETNFATKSRSSSVSSLSSLVSESNTNVKKSKKTAVNQFFDQVKPKEKAQIDAALAEFFFGCNIPFNVVETDHLEKFVKTLRPAYSLPTRNRLSTTLLDEAYEKCLRRDASINPTEGVLLIDGWKNSSKNTKNVVTMLHNANAEKKFVQAVDLSGESETGDRLAEIVKSSREICKANYNSDVFCVVSDNAANMLKMGRNLKSDPNLQMWYNNCSSHTTNLLAKDVLDEDLNNKVVAILKEFKRPDIEKYLTEAAGGGGTRVILPGDTRWCSYRDGYISLLKNHEKMSELCLKNATVKKKVKQEVKNYLVDEEFLKQVEERIQILDPICEIVNRAQRSSTTLGEIVDLWLDLKCPRTELEGCYTNRKNMAITDVALAAYMLDPKYIEDAPTKLSKEEYSTGKNFIMENLDAKGLSSYAKYLEKEDIFKMLFQKNCVDNPRTFWTLVREEHPILAKLGLKLSKIPASSAQLERVFSNWSFIHNPTRNRLSFDKSTKLIHVYYSLKITDKNKCAEY